MQQKVTNFNWLIAQLLLASISVQAGAAFAKQLFPYLGSEGATAMRLLIATIIVFIFYKPWQYNFRTIKSREWINLLLFGIFLALMNLFYYMAIERIPLGIAIALEFVGPVMLAITGGRKLIDFLWTIMVIIGLLLLLPIFVEDGNIDVLGFIFALASGFCWAMYIVFGKKTSTELGKLALPLAIGIATIIIFPIGIASSGWYIFYRIDILWLAVLVALMSTVIPYSLEMLVIVKMPTRLFGILMSLEPMIGAIIGVVFLGEILLVNQIIGILAIIIASIGATITTDN